MKITVITVCYNSKDSIENTIRSVIEQGYEELEYIIIDGGSTDGTVEIVRGYNDYITYFQSEPDNGIYDAMNKGLRHATGEVIAFLNSDDTYEPYTLNMVADYFATDTIDVLAGEVNQICNGKILPPNESDKDIEELHFYMIYCHQGIFMKKKVFDALGGFNTQYKLAADYELTLRAHNLGFRFKKVADIFANFSADGVSQTKCLECVREFKEIALDNTGQHGEKMTEQIHARVNFDVAYRQGIINVVCKEKSKFVKSLFENCNGVYIWGTGCIGARFLELLLRSGIIISGFIDSSCQGGNKWSFPVLSPGQLPSDAFVCIGTQTFESEIIHELETRKFERRQYISYGDFLQKVLMYGISGDADCSLDAGGMERMGHECIDDCEY